MNKVYWTANWLCASEHMISDFRERPILTHFLQNVVTRLYNDTFFRGLDGAFNERETALKIIADVQRV